MSKAGLFFKRNVHIFSAVGFIVVYLFLSVIFMLFGFDGVVSTIFSNIVLTVAGLIYIRVFFKPERHLVTHGYAGAMMGLLLIMWLFSQITATWVLNHVQDVGYENYVSTIDVNPAAYVVLALVFAPIAEEVLFRGIVFNAIKSRFPVWTAYVVSSLGFAIMHGTIIHIVIGFVCGMVFAMAYQYTGSIGWCITLHCVYNIMSVLLAGITVPDVFFNPAVFLTVDVLVLFAIWWECRRAGRSCVTKSVTKRVNMPELGDVSKSELIQDGEHDDDIVSGFVSRDRSELIPCRHIDDDVDISDCESYGLGYCYSKTGCCPYDKSE